jgi:glycosyltransferase involved in cell wall biosynthesis
MKVAIISYDFGEYCVRLASALSAVEVDVLLLLPEQLARPHLSQLRSVADCLLFPKPRLRQPRLQIGVLYQLIRRINAFKPDVIHLQQGHPWFNIILPLLRQYRLVVTVHDVTRHVGDTGSLKMPQKLMEFGFYRADQIIVQATQLKQKLKDGWNLPERTISVIPHIVLGDSAAPNQTVESEHSILFFGRIWGYKGLEYLIRAEPLITAQIPDVEIVIAGEGENFNRYRELMVHPQQFTVYNEYIADNRIAELFSRASVVVLPYIEASQSGVIPIAYTFAKPVVATTVGGLPDAVEDGRTGYLVPPRDESALADAVVRLLKNPELRHRLGMNAKRKAETELSGDVVARQTREVYCKALQRNSIPYPATDAVPNEV